MVIPSPSIGARRIWVGMLHLLCALSGAAGLGLQLTWTRRLALGLGHELPSTLAVVTAFFLGLTLGAAVLDRRLRCTREPLPWVIALETVMGVWTWLTLPLLPAVNEWARQGIGLDPSPLRQWGFCFVFPLLALLPATTAMGATLAAWERLLSIQAGTKTWIFGLYAINTAGAALGVFFTVGWLHPHLGFAVTTGLWGSVNLLCAGFLWGFRSRNPMDFEPPMALETLPSGPRPWGLWMRLALGGLAGMGLEVILVRMLGRVLEGTVFTYATVLVLWLVGTALGSLLGRVRKISTEAALIALCWSLPLLGMALGHSLMAFEGLRTRWGDAPHRVLMAEVVVAGVLVLPVTVWMGLVFSRWVQQVADARQGVGVAVAWNTLGSAAAPTLVGVLLFPLCGARCSLILLGLVYAVLIGRRWRSMLSALAGLVLLALAMPSDLRLVHVPAQSQCIEFHEGVVDSVAVMEQFGVHRTLSVNNRFVMGGTASTNAAARHSHLPLILHGHPRRALFLGLGTGISYAAMGSYPDLEADAVELLPEVVEVQRAFEPYNRRADSLSLHVADARRYVRTVRNSYDVIVADLFHPARDGAGGLYTVEHYKALKSCLNPDGLVCQWLPLYQLDAPTLRSIVRSFMEVFPETHAFLLRPNIDTPVLGLIGLANTPQWNPDATLRFMTQSTVLPSMKQCGLTDAYQVYGLWWAGPESLRRYSEKAMLNTDDHPVVIYSAPRATWNRSQRPSDLMLDLMDHFRGQTQSFPGWVGVSNGAEELRRLRAYWEARDSYLQGLVSEDAGQWSEAERLYLAGVRRSAEFTSGYSKVLTHAMSQARENPAEARRLLELLAAIRPERPIAADLLRRLPH